MFGETTISNVKIWNHAIFKGMFQVPGKSHEISRQHLASLLRNEHRMLELRRPFGIFCGHRPAIRPGDPFICAFSQDRFDGKSGAQLHLPGERRHPRCVCVCVCPMFKPILKVFYSEMYP